MPGSSGSVRKTWLADVNPALNALSANARETQKVRRQSCGQGTVVMENLTLRPTSVLELRSSHRNRCARTPIFDLFVCGFASA